MTILQNKLFDSGHAALPPIMLTKRDHEKLSQLAAARVPLDSHVRDFLADELERAVVLDRLDGPPTLVTMNSCVTFRDDQMKRISDVTLVYPEDADIAAGKISVLTPIGAALIGLSEGQSIEWQTRAGLRKSLTVLRVLPKAGMDSVERI